MHWNYDGISDQWVCCRCVAELEAKSTQPAEDPPDVVMTNSDSKVDGNCKHFITVISLTCHLCYERKAVAVSQGLK